MTNNSALKNSVLVLTSLMFIVALTSATGLAVHTSTAELQPEWSPAGQNVDYTVTLCNDINSADEIDEVRIYKNEDYTDFVADLKTGWYLGSYNPVKGYYPYTAENSGYYIDPDECTDFTFSATVPSQPSDVCDLSWKFETRDVTETWLPISDTTSIDSNVPIITKQIIGPQNGTCPPGNSTGEECWVMDHVTEIDIQVSDDSEEDCDSGIDYCEYIIYLDGVEHFKQTFDPEDPEMNMGWEVVFDEDSVHVLNITCVDIAGNKANDIEIFRVDSTPPNTTKIISEPKKVREDGVEWVDTVTNITFNATDPDPTGYECNIGVDKTWYKNILADGEEPCWNPKDLQYCNARTPSPYDNPETAACIDYWQEECWDDSRWMTEQFESWESCVEYYVHAKTEPLCGVDPEWHIWDGKPIQKPDESCHMLYYFSIDYLGNKEETKVNCFFVDKTPPFMDKNNGNALPGTGEPEFTNPDNPNGDFHWLTTKMPITFTCDDTYDGNAQLSPHPSEGEKLCFKVSYDYPQWRYITDQYCDPLTADGYCCVPVDPVTKKYDFYFKGESMHNLEYYCIDAVEKGKDDVHIQYYKVDDTKPIIDKIVGEPQYGACPPSQGYIDQEPFCYIRDHVTPVTFEAVDGEGLGCAVDDITCEWRYRVNGGEWSQVYTFSYKEGPFNSVSQPGSGQTEDWASAEIYKEYLSESIKWTFNITDINPNGDQYGVGLAIDSNDDGTPDFQIYFAEWSDQYWHYQPYGATCWSGTDTTTLPAGVVTTGSKTGRIFTIEIPKTMLGGSGTQFGWMSQVRTNLLGVYPGWTPWCGPFVWETEMVSPGIIFPEDSRHDLEIKCWDALGNEVIDEETFQVDSIPPETWKEYGKPYVEDVFPKGCEVECGWAGWINSSTPVYLDAEDNKVGVDKIYWRNLYIPTSPEADMVCGQPMNCNPDLYMNIVENPDEQFVEYTGEFYKEPESCHVIEYYSVDLLGNGKNMENLQWQCVFVDNSAPALDKEVGDPQYVEGADLYGADFFVSQLTPITMICDDRVGPHPVDHVNLSWRYRFNDDCSLLDESIWTDWDSTTGPTGDDPYLLEHTIYFTEDSCHELEYYCEDGLGNEHVVLKEIDIVDTKAPNSDLDTRGPVYEFEGATYVDYETWFSLTASDPEPHPSGVYDIYYAVTLMDNDDYCRNPGEFCDAIHKQGDDAFSSYDGEFNIPDTSCHMIEYYSEDNVENEESVNTFCVFADHDAPDILKDYGDGPFELYQFDDYWAKWITSNTSIQIEVEDPEPHPSGVNEVKYQYTRVDDEDCKYYYIDERPDTYTCDGVDGDGWTTGNESFVFRIPEDSCHMIEVMATDNVGKCSVHRQWVYVDNQAPEPNKTVGDPKSTWDGQDSDFYPWIADKCWNENESLSIDCWKVTMMTPIAMDCEDQGPHPVYHEEVCFNVEVDALDDTERYCDYYEGDLTEVNGTDFCCVEYVIEDFYFLEETEHNLKYYCEDALENRGPIDDEKFKVQGTVFKIPLYRKWNLISVPFVLLDSAPEEVFNNTPGIDSVWMYDPVTCEDQSGWCVWSPGEMPDNLDDIKPGWGYWVLEMGDEEWLTLGGSLFSARGGSLLDSRELPPTRELSTGWNLIGYYGTSWELYDVGDANFVCGDAYVIPDKYIYGDKAYCSLNSLVDTQEGYPRWSSLWSYIRCPGESVVPDAYWTGINTCADQDSPMQMALSRMYAGRGYWLEMDVEDRYAPATTCIWNDDFQCRMTGGGILP